MRQRLEIWSSPRQRADDKPSNLSPATKSTRHA